MTTTCMARVSTPGRTGAVTKENISMTKSTAKASIAGPTGENTRADGKRVGSTAMASTHLPRARVRREYGTTASACSGLVEY